MNTPWANVLGKGIDRKYGGTSVSMVADPYISGYHFIKVIDIPTALVDILRSNSYTSNIESKFEIVKLLEGSCLSVTVPGGTLNKTEFVGLGNVKWSVPTSVDYGGSLTMKFLEFSSLPILNIFHNWVRMIRDYRTGTTQLDGVNNVEYTKSNYAGTILYWTTKPDATNVEFAACYTGVFPTKDPQDLFSGDLSSIDKLEIDIEFNVDYAWHEPWVYALAQDEASKRGNSGRPTGPGGFRSSIGNGVDSM